MSEARFMVGDRVRSLGGMVEEGAEFTIVGFTKLLGGDLAANGDGRQRNLCKWLELISRPEAPAFFGVDRTTKVDTGIVDALTKQFNETHERIMNEVFESRFAPGEIFNVNHEPNPPRLDDFGDLRPLRAELDAERQRANRLGDQLGQARGSLQLMREELQREHEIARDGESQLRTANGTIAALRDKIRMLTRAAR